MRAGDITNELRTFYKDGVPYMELNRHLAEEDVLRWTTISGWCRRQLFDEVAKRLAIGFHTSELSFEFCDAVVKDLFGPVTNTSGPKPELFWAVYSAFDEGEYYHGNNRNVDPVETYTRPVIAQIAAQLSVDE